MNNLQELLSEAEHTAKRIQESRFVHEESSDLAAAVLQLSQVVRALLLTRPGINFPTDGG
ncbi:MAG TPA: hypothetical protein VL528_10755 [Oxalicibacterium sp.]|jgi:hypothetical protein|nr:hypothetical protein [Oxalicibacterium sp.]